MKLSTKGRYGVMAMLDMAIYHSEGIISINNIAERQGISANYLEQLFVLLKKSGLVTSVRGPQGGYALAESPGDITVGMVLRALEGSLAPVGCVIENEPEKCCRYDDCATRYVWKKVRDGINEVVDGITLENLVEEYKKQDIQGDYTYCI